MDADDARLPPYSDQAERGVLGSLLVDWERASGVVEDIGVTAADFYVPAHRLTFAAMRDTMKADTFVDSLTVAETLTRTGDLDRIGGALFLDRLIDDTPTAAHVESYAEIVHDRAMRRAIIAQARDAERQAHDADQDAEVIRSQVESGFANLEISHNGHRTLADMVGTQIERWERARETKAPMGIPTGFRILDVYFGGLMDGAMYYVSAEPGRGKTTLVRNIVENVSMRGVPVLFFSLEQTAEQIAGAMAARMGRQSVWLLNQGSPHVKWPPLVNAASQVAQWPLTIVDEPQTATTIWSKSRRAVDNGCRVIAVDYIQMVTADRRSDSAEQQIASISQSLTNMAKALKVPVLCISAESREGRLRGSGMLDFNAWAHFRLERADEWTEDSQVYDVQFRKNRFGPPKQGEKLILIGNEQRFDEPRWGIDETDI